MGCGAKKWLQAKDGHGMKWARWTKRENGWIRHESRPHSKSQFEDKREEIPEQRKQKDSWQSVFSSAFQVVRCHDWILREFALRQKAPWTKTSDDEEPQIRDSLSAKGNPVSKMPWWTWMRNPGQAAEELLVEDPGSVRSWTTTLACLPRRRLWLP